MLGPAGDRGADTMLRVAVQCGTGPHIPYGVRSTGYIQLRSSIVRSTVLRFPGSDRLASSDSQDLNSYLMRQTID
jgi:hypothetical protein